MKRSTRRRSIFRIALAVGAVCAVLALLGIAAILVLRSFLVQDAVYDNVPSKASCS
ncbi:hypothetical protein [Brevibacterium ravenspurgense]|uniref:hypothetical protein n=1 Tax=Brevibacterium ravenspurgense TaxID=479117 RepID=UPI0012E7E9C8|nr:hypothetical protein [Brevibacterium ravenspurgense]